MRGRPIPPPESDTPLTDAEYQDNGHEVHSETHDGGEIVERAVDIEFARKVERSLAQAQARIAEIEKALEESVKLQSHYAKLLNMHGGGSRMDFANAAAWLDRLDHIAALAAEKEWTK